MNERWIASTPFVAVFPPDDSATIVVRVAEPMQRGSDEWECAIAIDGMYDGIMSVVATDAIQSLGLAWRLVGRLLHRFETAGGHLESDGERVALSAYFGSELAEPDSERR